MSLDWICLTPLISTILTDFLGFSAFARAVTPFATHVTATIKSKTLRGNVPTTSVPILLGSCPCFSVLVLFDWRRVLSLCLPGVVSFAFAFAFDLAPYLCSVHCPDLHWRWIIVSCCLFVSGVLFRHLQVRHF